MKDLIIEPTNTENYVRLYANQNVLDVLETEATKLEYVQDATKHTGHIGIRFDKRAEEADLSAFFALARKLATPEPEILNQHWYLDEYSVICHKSTGKDVDLSNFLQAIARLPALERFYQRSAASYLHSDLPVE